VFLHATRAQEPKGKTIYEARYLDRQTTIFGGTVNDVLVFLGLFIHVTQAQEPKSKPIYEAWYLDCGPTFLGGMARIAGRG
jgi:hypothetical protein